MSQYFRATWSLAGRLPLHHWPSSLISSSSSSHTTLLPPSYLLLLICLLSPANLSRLLSFSSQLSHSLSCTSPLYFWLLDLPVCLFLSPLISTPPSLPLHVGEYSLLALTITCSFSHKVFCSLCVAEERKNIFPRVLWVDIYENVSLVQRKRRRQQIKRDRSHHSRQSHEIWRGQQNVPLQWADLQGGFKYSVKLLTHSKFGKAFLYWICMAL